MIVYIINTYLKNKKYGWMKKINQQKTKYILHRHCKIASSNTSRLEAHVEFFILLMKGIFGPYVLRPFDNKLILLLVTRIRIRNYTIY